MSPTGWPRQLALLLGAFAVTCAVVSAGSDLSAGMTAAQIVFIITLVLVIVRGSD